MLGALCSVVLMATSGAALAQTPDSTVIYAEESDAELNAAMKAARESLPVFWSHFEKQGPDVGPFLLKVALPTKDESLEHIWMLVTERGEKITGTLVNKPVNIAGVSQGSKVTVTPQQVSDWTYIRGGIAYGQFTNRVLAKQLDGAQREAMLSGLSPNPIEGAKP